MRPERLRPGTVSPSSVSDELFSPDALLVGRIYNFNMEALEKLIAIWEVAQRRAPCSYIFDIFDEIEYWLHKREESTEPSFTFASALASLRAAAKCRNLPNDAAPEATSVNLFETKASEDDGLMMDLWSLIYFIVRVITWITFDTLKYFQDIRLSRRPICTTMPWTIRVALAVIWGVCWMFYYTPADALDLENEPRLRSPSIPPPLPSALLPQLDLLERIVEHGDGGQEFNAPDSDYDLPDWWDEELATMLLHPQSRADPTDTDISASLGNDQSTAVKSYDSTQQELPQPSRASIGPLESPASYSPLRQTATSAGAIPSMEQSRPTDRSRGTLDLSTDAPARQEIEKLRCPDCGVTASNAFVLSRHQREQHATNPGVRSYRPYQCPYHGCTFGETNSVKRPYNLQRHMKTCKHRPPQASSVTRTPRLSTSETLSRAQADDGNDPDDRRLIQDLKRKRDIRSQVLEAKRKECEEMRAKLAEKKRECEEAEASLDRVATMLEDLEAGHER